MRGKGGKDFKKTTSKGRKIKRLRARPPFSNATPLDELQRELRTEATPRVDISLFIRGVQQFGMEDDRV